MKYWYFAFGKASNDRTLMGISIIGTNELCSVIIDTTRTFGVILKIGRNGYCGKRQCKQILNLSSD